MKRQIVIELVSFLFILLFVYAAMSKVSHFQRFEVQVSQSPILTNIAWPVALGIPLVEIFIALMLALPRFRLIALYASFSLMVIFTVYIIVIMNFSSYVPCSCGGILSSMSWGTHLVFNVFFVALAVVGVLLQERKEGMRALAS